MKWLLPWLAAVVVAGGVVLAVNSMTGEELAKTRPRTETPSHGRDALHAYADTHTSQ